VNIGEIVRDGDDGRGWEKRVRWGVLLKWTTEEQVRQKRKALKVSLCSDRGGIKKKKRRI